MEVNKELLEEMLVYIEKYGRSNRWEMRRRKRII